MDLQEALEFLDNQGYYLKENKKYKTDDEIEITPDIDETLCPNCGEEGESTDQDTEDNWVFDYYTCPKCNTKWRVDSEVKPKYIVIK